jgi:hypothetical protein
LANDINLAFGIRDKSRLWYTCMVKISVVVYDINLGFGI